MKGLKISEAARRTGFSESALRFYEQQGVVVPERTDTGYLAYTESDVDSLLFVSRAKRLGLSLDDITELLVLLDEEECGPVQQRMRSLVSERIVQAQDQLADLVEFTGQLQQVAARLGNHTADGPCDDLCGCRTDPVDISSSAKRLAVPLVAINGQDVACTLEGVESVEQRISDWRRLIAQATGREQIPDGVRLAFPRTTDVAAIADLAAAEQTCCSFFRFRIGIESDSVTLDVTGPEASHPVITSIFGGAA